MRETTNGQAKAKTQTLRKSRERTEKWDTAKIVETSGAEALIFIGFFRHG